MIKCDIDSLAWLFLAKRSVSIIFCIFETEQIFISYNRYVLLGGRSWMKRRKFRLSLGNKIMSYRDTHCALSEIRYVSLRELMHVLCHAERTAVNLQWDIGYIISLFRQIVAVNYTYTAQPTDPILRKNSMKYIFLMIVKPWSLDSLEANIHENQDYTLDPLQNKAEYCR